jgi:aminoglycoside phosphotransferase family enzyme/predicted kinase
LNPISRKNISKKNNPFLSGQIVYNILIFLYIFDCHFDHEIGTEMNHQDKIFEAMSRPEFYPHPVSNIEQRETHISHVFLTGDYVYKIKKPVNLDFLDFTTLKKRCYYCRQEVILNKRLSHNVYLDAVPINLKEGKYRVNGPGIPVEYAVKMRQLPWDRSMVNLLKRKKVNRDLVKELSEVLAEFYSRSPSVENIHAAGDWETVLANCEENFRQTIMFAGEIVDDRIFQIVRSSTLSFLYRKKELFGNRIKSKKIRDCHGDLRAGHIYFTDEGIQIIDCIEFNERFRFQDVTSDLAFLAMDLDYEGFPQIADDLLEDYAKRTQDPDLFVLIDFYKCYRAFVRCKVHCIRLQDKDLDKQVRKKLIRGTRKYLDLAYQYAGRFTRPTLWVVCGMPGSGKSTISNELSRIFRIKSFQSDVIRKELHGLKPGDFSDIPFETGIYSKGASNLTYGRLLLLAQEEIEQGRSVVLDATYSRRQYRSEALRLANDIDANIIFVECVLTENIVRERLLKREAGYPISDARYRHYEDFKKEFEPMNELSDSLNIRVDTEQPLKECIAQILARTNPLMARKP